MSTITITHKFGRAMTKLQGGGRVLFHRWHRNDQRYFVTDDTRGYDINEDLQIDQEMLKLFLKYKWIEQTPNDFRWPIRKTWKISDVGKEFKLPPAQYWVNEE